MIRLFLVLPLWLILFPSYSLPEDSSAYKGKGPKIILASGTTLATLGSLTVLHHAWYKPYSTGKFHFFNDNGEWLQMDKAGHVYSSYQLSRLMMDAFEWAGFSKRKTVWLGGSIGFFYLSAIEVMDGYSRGWGFSMGDQFANAAGALFAISQRHFWEKQRISLKFSFAQSGLAQYNPSLLGETAAGQVLKDYNGQTYWLSFNPLVVMGIRSRIPEWINLSFGYGAYGMTGGHYNRVLPQDEMGNVILLERSRRFFTSVDIDLTRLPVKNKTLRSLCSVFNILKIPAPSLEFSRGRARFHAFYF